MSEKKIERYPLEVLVNNAGAGRVTRKEYVGKLIRDTAHLDAGILFRFKSNPFRYRGTIQECFLEPFSKSPKDPGFFDPDEDEDIVDLAFYMAGMAEKMSEPAGASQGGSNSNKEKGAPPLFTKQELLIRRKQAKVMNRYMNLCVLDVFNFLDQYAERLSFDKNAAINEARYVLKVFGHKALLRHTKVYMAVKLVTQSYHCLKEFTPKERRMLEWLILYPMWMKFPENANTDEKSA